MTQQNCKTELAIHILGQVQGKGQTVSIMKSANGVILLIPINPSLNIEILLSKK